VRSRTPGTGVRSRTPGAGVRSRTPGSGPSPSQFHTPGAKRPRSGK
jgi:hypothetical protein